VGKWKPADLLGFHNLFNAKYGVEEAQSWPGSRS